MKKSLTEEKKSFKSSSSRRSSIHLVETVSLEGAKGLESTKFWEERHILPNKIFFDIYPGTHLVAHPEDAKEIAKFQSIDDIIFELDNDDTNVVLKEMKACSCFENTHKLVKTKKVKEGYVGWALTNDGLWRLHAWGVDSKNRVVETTVLRAKYIGVTRYENVGGLVLCTK